MLGATACHPEQALLPSEKPRAERRRDLGEPRVAARLLRYTNRVKSPLPCKLYYAPLSRDLRHHDYHVPVEETLKPHARLEAIHRKCESRILEAECLGNRLLWLCWP